MFTQFVPVSTIYKNGKVKSCEKLVDEADTDLWNLVDFYRNDNEGWWYTMEDYLLKTDAHNYDSIMDLFNAGKITIVENVVRDCPFSMLILYRNYAFELKIIPYKN